MAKFQRLINITLIFYSCLTTSWTAKVIPSESKVIHAEDDSELLLVSTVFRHGDRTIDRSSRESYPNDPYNSHNFYPVGDGQLTNDGKQRSYELGLLLRNKYNSFLGDVYYPPYVYARCTEVIRTKMTLQLVLAALYPPIDKQKWNEKLSWQPIDLIYTPIINDDLLFPIVCSTYREIYRDYLKNPKVKEKIEEFKDLMAITSKHTGKSITNLTDLALLYNTLYAESNMNLTLPNWTHDIFPKGALSNAVHLFLELLSYDQLNNLNGGVLLNRIIDDMNKVINKSLPDRKINLFSAHDINVAGLLHALNISKYHIPEYTSSVIIELRKKDEEYFVKVLHYLGIPPTILQVQIPGCEILCPYNKFVKLTESITVFKQPCHPTKPKRETSLSTI